MTPEQLTSRPVNKQVKQRFGKMLSSFSSLDRHMLVHSGERPFSCNLCGQTFTTNGNMHRHSRTHGHRELEGMDGKQGVEGTGASTPRRPGRKRKHPPPSESCASPTNVPPPPPHLQLPSAPAALEPKDVEMDIVVPQQVVRPASKNGLYRVKLCV